MSLQYINCERMRARISVLQCCSNQMAKRKNSVNGSELSEPKYPSCADCDQGRNARKTLAGDRTECEGAARRDPAPVILEKQCNRCLETLPASEFAPMKSRKDGLDFMCRGCRESVPLTLVQPEGEQVEVNPDAGSAARDLVVRLDADLYRAFLAAAAEEEREPEAHARYLIKRDIRSRGER